MGRRSLEKGHDKNQFCISTLPRLIVPSCWRMFVSGQRSAHGQDVRTVRHPALQINGTNEQLASRALSTSSPSASSSFPFESRARLLAAPPWSLLTIVPPAAGATPSTHAIHANVGSNSCHLYPYYVSRHLSPAACAHHYG